MRKIFLLISFSIWIFNANSQSKFSDYQGVDKVLIQNQEFGYASPNWLVANKDNLSSKIDDSYYKLINTDDSISKMVYSHIPFDENQNFELTTKMKIISGADFKFFGILWGCSNTKDFGFYINKNKQFKIVKFDKNYSLIKGSSPFEKLKTNDLNTLTIRKIENQYFFFINEEFVFQCNFQPFFGNYIGFLVPSKSELWIENYQLNYIPISTIQPRSYNEIQRLEAVKNYSNLDKKRLTLLFEEEFTDNLKFWNVGSNDSVIRLIENGYYALQNNSSEYYSAWNEIPFEHNSDFEIETSIKFIDGADKNENCLLWGSKEKYSYRFGFNGDGSIIIYKSVNGVFSKILNFTYCKAIKKSAYNKFTIRKLAKMYYFFVNENLVYFTKFEDFFGDIIGYVVSKKSSIRIDNLKISTISN